MTGLKVILWNCGGLCASTVSTPFKMGFFDKEFTSSNFHVAAFVETHHKGEKDFPALLHQYALHYHLSHTPTPPGYTHGGVIVFVDKSYDIVSSAVVIPGRLLHLIIRHSVTAHEYNLSVFYGPILAKMVASQIRSTLGRLMGLHHLSQNNVVLGDFNFVVDDLDKGHGMDARDRIVFRTWDPFLSAVNLFDPFRAHNPEQRLYSFVSPAGKSRGDRVYVNAEIVNQVVDLRYLPIPFNLAHKVLTFTIRDQRPSGRGYWKMNSSILNDPAYVRLIELTVVEVDSLTGLDAQRWWDVFLSAVRSKTIDYTSRKRLVEKTTRSLLHQDLLRLEAVTFDRLTPAQQGLYAHLKERLRVFEEKEVEGYRCRLKGLPQYEQSAPDIAFYATLEKRRARKALLGELADATGQVYSDIDHLIPIVTEFYQGLYTPLRVHLPTQSKLLANVGMRFSSLQRQQLDAPFTAQELHKAVLAMHDDKSPGIDGISAEFYKKFWYLLGARYFDFLTASKVTQFPLKKNISVTALIYKDRGAATDLANYRPISLLNVDLKILSKALTTRLGAVLSDVIHYTQTAVAGRQIDHTVHMLRDLIQLADNEDSAAAFIFLDQEKAFDRVDHDFLFRTMSTFGIGDSFLGWVKCLYSNAHTRVKVNGFLTANIPLKRGVRQGCPLSPLLYAFIIEILALQLRRNPEVVGFTVGGEKIISLHYADDAIITITQNCCFKEVYKDLKAYEWATGAKINYGKTKGLWAGAWRGREDTPWGLTWTSDNVETLGLYFGNADPAGATFQRILPRLQRSMNYWKRFRLCKLAKARVVEIFHASRLWYAARFYPIPSPLTRQFHKAFMEYLNFPLRTVTIGQDELRKLREHGGAKLVDVTCKSHASKVQWLMALCDQPCLATHLALVTRLLGVQRGDLSGSELFFTTKHYAARILSIRTAFYTEAIKAMTSLDVRKRVLDPDLEKVFYNPVFTGVTGYTMSINQPCVQAGIYTYGRLREEVARRYARGVTTLLRRMVHKDFEDREDYQVGTVNGYVKFSLVTQRLLYSLFLKHNYRDHHSSAKWVLQLGVPLEWDKIWPVIHNPLAFVDTTSLVWEQVHLNSYNTYSYNKWHNATLPCPLCLQIPTDRFHLILTCPTTVSLWAALTPFLQRLSPLSPTPFEMAFGLPGAAPNICLRNWLTFLLRECISRQELSAYHNQRGLFNERGIRRVYNARVVRETLQWLFYYTHHSQLDVFQTRYGYNGVFIRWEGERCVVTQLFPT